MNTKTIDFEKELTTNALRIDQIDKLAVKAVIEWDTDKLFDLIEEYGELKKNIRERLLTQSSVKLSNQKAREIIRIIDSGTGLQIDAIIKLMEDKFEIEGLCNNINQLEDYKIEEIASDVYHSWFSHAEYVRGLFNINSLIFGATIPSALEKYIDEARTCFAFQCYIAVFAMCRTILETSLRDVAQRIDLLPKDETNIIHLKTKKIKWSDLANKIVPGQLRNQIDEIYSSTSFLIHGNKTVNKEEATITFKKTISVIQALYDYHKLS